MAKHRGSARSVFEGVQRLGDFSGSLYRARRPRGTIRATPASQDRASIRGDFRALRRDILEGIRLVIGERWLKTTARETSGSYLREFLDKGGNYELAMRWTDREGRVWYSGIDPPTAEATTPTFDEMESTYTRIQDAYRSFSVRESVDGRISGMRSVPADDTQTEPRATSDGDH
ncbi:hypothetical protein AB0873_20780 [Micromonospora sp. NPDC047707]|uniref:hypothetical protein n=1 Tax=Micromonospora sp. NPDC047707 TaxID=3154498 RepID=UPI0034552112